MIEIKNLTKIYGNHCAVDHLNITLEDGKIYGFLGPNGAGKSTTMNMVTGYLSPTEGDVLIDGYSIRTEPEKAKKQVGYLPEHPPLYMDMSVNEYLLFVADLKKVPKKEQKAQVERAKQLTHLVEMQNRLIRNLSKGYRQRVGVAQAMLGSPKILILDEPTVGLDPQQIIEIRELIKELSKTQTIILSSHILSEVQAVCDHILIINRGKLLANDTAENLERNLLGDESLKLEIAASESEVKALLSKINGVNNCIITTDEGITHVTIPCKHGFDPRIDVFNACAKANCPILSMEYAKSTLEQVFLKLTQSSAGKQ